MNTLDLLFERKKENLLALYFTAGFPKRESLNEIIASLQPSETDIIEIGIPFSDPMADGVVIQQSSKAALENGMTIDLLFEQLKNIESRIPLVIMTYFNPVFKFGFEKFCRLCQEHGISGLIIPDLPLIEYKNHYKTFYEKYQLKFIPLVCPNTGEERIRSLCEAATGFVYMVSGNQITGTIQGRETEGEGQAGKKRNSVKDVMKYAQRKPVLMGFGINSAQKFANACETVNGGIIGSAYIECLSKNQNNIQKATIDFVKKIKQEVYDHPVAP